MRAVESKEDLLARALEELERAERADDATRLDVLETLHRALEEEVDEAASAGR
jgi:hypothetical protein